MRNAGVLAGREELAAGLVRPVYGGYSFGAIPATVAALLTGERRGAPLPADCLAGLPERPRLVVVLLIDSFGWPFWGAHADRFEITRRIDAEGIVTPLSALFPSTTSASISTMHLGVPPSRHGLVEWNLYIEAYGRVIQTLPFAPLGERGGDGLVRRGHDPRHLLRADETLHQWLAARGVASQLVVSRSYADSTYNRIVSAGARVHPFDTLAHGLMLVKEAMEAATGPTYLFFYWGDIDSVAHHHGPESAVHRAEIAGFWRTVEAVFDAPRRRSDAVVLVTADHGQVWGDPAATVHLNRALPALTPLLRPDAAGRPIPPTGSPRDLFLHLRPGAAGAAADLLRGALGDAAHILTTDEALAEGLFGPPPYEAEFRRRLGDLLVLPRAGRYVWWLDPPRMENDFFGHHGGLAADEMTTVVAATDVW